MIATCATCGEKIPLTHIGGGRDELWVHDEAHRNGVIPPRIVQLPGVTFHEQALLAIKSFAVTGREFTIGECHPLVGITPLDPARDWPRATNEAKRLGWIERVDYAQSVVTGSHRSAVAVWRGTYAATRGNAA